MSFSSETSSSIQETSASVEELTAAVHMSTENAQNAAELAEQSRLAAVNRDRQVRDLMGSIHKIDQSSSKIEEITTVIDDPAFQTNVLALNAAVEFGRNSEQVLKDIVQSVEKVAALNGQISTASKEQTHGLSQITSAISRMDTSAQSHTKATSEITDMTYKIYSESEKMRELIYVMKTRIGYSAEDKKAS